MQQPQLTSQEQLKKIAACHMISFPGSFGTRLGFAYAQKSLEWFLAGENRFLFHVIEGDAVIGYCGGFQSTGIGDGSTSGMMQYAMKEAAMGMLKKPWLFFHTDVLRFYPLIIKNIFRKISPADKKIHSVITAKKIVVPRIGLVVIGIHPDHRGKGCFEMLMQYFETCCKKRGVAEMALSVKSSNIRAIAAYKKMGWHITAQTTDSIDMSKTVIS